MSVKFSTILDTHAALTGAVREALQAINAELVGYRLTEWPAEKAGCFYALSVTLERAGNASEAGECRFAIGLNGQTYFDADDAPLAPCAADAGACRAVLENFVARRTTQERARNAA